MTWKASLVLVALVIACGDSSNGSGGDAGNGGGGTAGSGGGAGGEGGEGGAGGAEAEFGELLPCDDIVRHNTIREEWEYIPTTPGEVFYITRCDHYDIVDGVLNVDSILPPGCATWRHVADGDEYRQWCRDFFFHGPLRTVPDPGFEYYMEFGWERYYLRRE